MCCWDWRRSAPVGLDGGGGVTVAATTVPAAVMYGGGGGGDSGGVGGGARSTSRCGTASTTSRTRASSGPSLARSWSRQSSHPQHSQNKNGRRRLPLCFDACSCIARARLCGARFAGGRLEWPAAVVLNVPASGARSTSRGRLCCSAGRTRWSGTGWAPSTSPYAATAGAASEARRGSPALSLRRPCSGEPVGSLWGARGAARMFAIPANVAIRERNLGLAGEGSGRGIVAARASSRRFRLRIPF